MKTAGLLHKCAFINALRLTGKQKQKQKYGYYWPNLMTNVYHRSTFAVERVLFFQTFRI